MKDIKAGLDQIREQHPNFVDMASKEVFRPTNAKKVADPIPSRAWTRATKERVALMQNRSKLRIGIPRVLNIYTYAPLFNAYFESLGLQSENIIYSDYTSSELYRAGASRGSQLFDLKRFAIFEIGAQSVHGLAKDAIRFAFVHFKRTNLINEIVDHVTQMHGVQHSEAEVDREFQSWFSRFGFDSVAIFEQQHTEAVKASILKRETVFGFIHSKAARSTGTRGK